MAWPVKKWNRGFNQHFTIREADDTTKNLSGYTVTLKVKMGDTLLVSGACTLVSADLGYVRYTVQSGDFPYHGRADYEFELVRTSSLVETETYPVHIGRTI